MLGEDILVAPVLEEGITSRNIYLPEGEWIDKKDGSIHQGPVWLNDYAAPLEVLPYFVRSSSDRVLALKGLTIALIGLINLMFTYVM